MFATFTKHCCGWDNDLEGHQYIFLSRQDSNNNFKKLFIIQELRIRTWESIIQELQRIRMWELLTSMIK